MNGLLLKHCVDWNMKFIQQYISANQCQVLPFLFLWRVIWSYVYWNTAHLGVSRYVIIFMMLCFIINRDETENSYFHFIYLLFFVRRFYVCKHETFRPLSSESEKGQHQRMSNNPVSLHFLSYYHFYSRFIFFLLLQVDCSVTDFSFFSLSRRLREGYLAISFTSSSQLIKVKKRTCADRYCCGCMYWMGNAFGVF